MKPFSANYPMSTRDNDGSLLSVEDIPHNAKHSKTSA